MISLTFNPLVRDVILFHLLAFLKINETYESFWRTVTKRVSLSSRASLNTTSYTNAVSITS